MSHTSTQLASKNLKIKKLLLRPRRRWYDLKK